MLPACILKNSDYQKLIGVTIDRMLSFNEYVTNSRSLNKCTNRLHERGLNLVYNEFLSSFSELFEKNKSVTIHHRNLQTLANEIFKVKNNITPEILTEIFSQKESNYSIRNRQALQGRSIKTVMYVL